MINTINIATILFLLVVYILSGIAKSRVEKAIKQSSEFEGTAKQRKALHYLNIIEVLSMSCMVPIAMFLFIYLISR